MEIALSVLAMIALVAFIWFIVVAIRTLRITDDFLLRSETVLAEIKKDMSQMTSEVSVIRIHAVPVLDNIADISQRVSGITEGLAPRVEAIYDTVDDTLNVVRGALDDVERIKESVVQTIETPLNAVKRTSTGVVGTIVKGVSVVRDLIGEFRKNGSSH
jgi:uncharacterized protein YoxC